MRTSVVWSFSLPPDMADELETILVQEQRTKSELVREALRHYMADAKWTAVQQELSIRARGAGIIAESDVEYLVDSLRS